MLNQVGAVYLRIYVMELAPLKWLWITKISSYKLSATDPKRERLLKLNPFGLSTIRPLCTMNSNLIVIRILIAQQAYIAANFLLS